LVALLTVVAFLPALSNDFVNWDDDRNLIDNPSHRGLGWTQLSWMFSTFHEGHYQPLSWLTFAIDYLTWGMNPAGYHLTNLVLHGANAVFFYFVARRLLFVAVPQARVADNWRLSVSAGFAALLFAVHPLRVESVAWATERRDTLSALFFLARSTFTCARTRLIMIERQDDDCEEEPAEMDGSEDSPFIGDPINQRDAQNNQIRRDGKPDHAVEKHFTRQ
jgi:hypothetical protein